MGYCFYHLISILEDEKSSQIFKELAAKFKEVTDDFVSIDEKDETIRMHYVKSTLTYTVLEMSKLFPLVRLKLESVGEDCGEDNVTFEIKNGKILKTFILTPESEDAYEFYMKVSEDEDFIHVNDTYINSDVDPSENEYFDILRKHKVINENGDVISEEVVIDPELPKLEFDSKKIEKATDDYLKTYLDRKFDLFVGNFQKLSIKI
jgi:hypothetical protein